MQTNAGFRHLPAQGIQGNFPHRQQVRPGGGSRSSRRMARSLAVSSGMTKGLVMKSSAPASSASTLSSSLSRTVIIRMPAPGNSRRRSRHASIPMSRHVDIQQNGVLVPGGQIEPMLAAGSFIRPVTEGGQSRSQRPPDSGRMKLPAASMGSIWPPGTGSTPFCWISTCRDRTVLRRAAICGANCPARAS